MSQNDNYIKEIWLAIQKFVEEDYSVILCRAEDETINGKLKKAKSPLVQTWSDKTDQKLSLASLSSILYRYPHTKVSIGTICGEASGNLEIIDIDPKHWEGIVVVFLVTLKETFPELYAKLRIHRTPSGGLHIIYRCEQPIGEGSMKLAYKEGVKDAGIETRGQGGYFIVPPSKGYSVFQDVPIPVITRWERDCLINLCRMFDEKKKKVISPSNKQYERIFTINPYDDFNASHEGSQVFVQHGWQEDSDTQIYTYYTRPGKDGGKSASYNKDKKCYYNFTSSTDLEPSRGYSPSALLCHLQFNGVYKQLYRYLTERGYGRLKPEYESKCVKKFAETGKELPKYFSKDAQAALVKAVQEREEKYPHGTFWEYIPESDSYLINRELLLQFMIAIGLCLFKGEPCLVNGQFIHKLKEDRKKPGARDIFRMLNGWIREGNKEVFNKIRHEFSKFWQYHGEHMVGVLPELDSKRILRSSSAASYNFFPNTILEITSKAKNEIPYEQKPNSLIWAHNVRERPWKYATPDEQKKCIYGDFLSKAILGSADYLKLIIGYLCCGYKGPNENYLIALLESIEASLGGGTGKGFFIKILRFWTGVLVRNGIAVKKDIEQLLQSWDGEEIFHLSDFPKGIDLSYLKHLVSDDSQLKKLYKDIMNIASEDMPKFVVSGQFGLNVEDDGGNRRRVRMLPFSSVFQGHDSLRRAYGGELPDIWTEADWNGYFSIIADAVQAYLAVRSLEIVENDELWLKSYDAMYAHNDSYLREAIDEASEGWCGKDYWFSDEISEWYTAVCERNRVLPSERMVGMRKVHKAVKGYLERYRHYSYEYGKDRISNNGSRPWIVRIRKLNDE